MTNLFIARGAEVRRDAVGDEKLGQRLEYLHRSQPPGDHDCQAFPRILLEDGEGLQRPAVLRPVLLTSALQNPTLLEAELGRRRRRARDGTDRDVLAWIEATFGVRIPAVACCEGHVAPAQAFLDALFARAPVALWIASRGFGGKTSLLALLAAANAPGRRRLPQPAAFMAGHD